jgi:hypothetical protein
MTKVVLAAHTDGEGDTDRLSTTADGCNKACICGNPDDETALVAFA